MDLEPDVRSVPVSSTDLEKELRELLEQESTLPPNTDDGIEHMLLA